MTRPYNQQTKIQSNSPSPKYPGKTTDTVVLSATRSAGVVIKSWKSGYPVGDPSLLDALDATVGHEKPNKQSDEG